MAKSICIPTNRARGLPWINSHGKEKESKECRVRCGTFVTKTPAKPMVCSGVGGVSAILSPTGAGDVPFISLTVIRCGLFPGG